MNENIRLDDSTVFNPSTGEFASLPQILIFSADKEILTDNTPSIVSWSVANATLVKLNNEVVESTGTREFYTVDLLILTLSASNEVGAAESKVINIDINRQLPVIHSFTANVEYAIKGFPIMLCWIVEDAFNLEIIDVENVTNKNSTIVSQIENGLYILKASNYFNFSVEERVIIPVFPVPLIKSILIPTPQFSQIVNLSKISIVSPKINLSVNLKTSLMQVNEIEFSKLNEDAKKLIFSKKVKSRNPIKDIFEIISQEIKIKVFKSLNK